jgi:putative ABC transport system permease protein
VSGDLREMFIDRLSHKGRLIASVYYLIDAILSARNFGLRRKQVPTSNNNIDMLKNYIKITIRTISKNKVYSALNIVGLALGIAACLFILQYVSYERSYDKFHVSHESLYRVKYMVYRNGKLDINCAAAVPRVGPFMKEKMPQVVDFACAYPTSGVITHGDIKFRENRIQIVDQSFLGIFSFPLTHGDPSTALKEPNRVVISETAALKYFGNEEAIGKTIRMDGKHSLAVTGVVKDVPNNSHIKFDFL